MNTAVWVANIAVGLWGYFYPQPYDACLVVLMIIPWLAIPAGRYTGSRQALAYSVMFPITALLCRTTEDLETFPLMRGVLIGSGIAALVMAILFLADRKALQSVLACLVIAWCYGYGTALELNTLLDLGNSKQTRVPIVSRDWGGGRYLAFEVVLGNHRANVSWNTYVSLRGQTVACVNSGPGAMGIRWYQVERCK